MENPQEKSDSPTRPGSSTERRRPSSPETLISKRGDSVGRGEEGKSCLVHIYPTDVQHGLIELTNEPFYIGRDPDCQLEFSDSSVSRRHACIEVRGGNYMISDAGSTNGTYVNNELVEKAFLVSGDFIRIGSHIVKFLASDHVEAQYHETIYTMMITDGLTSVHNKRFFLEALDREIARSVRHQRPLCLALLDIDHFKKLNDTYGHLAGDAVLREFCGRIGGSIRKDEVFARFGGEEFAVILPEATLQQAVTFSERLRAQISDTPMIIDTVEIGITMSVGIAQTNGEEDVTPESLIAAADQKLYEAKRSGRNRVVA